MIETSDLQGLQNNINYLSNCETLDKDSAIDCLYEIFDILLKMNKMKIKEYDYGGGAYIAKENEE